MNKKFLSAILFGALMATSAGTFVSCKDYDDDIKGLQTQIDTNKTAIAELQKLVGSGNWVTSVAASGENLVVTMSNGTTATIAGIKGADGKDGKNAAEWTIGEDGFWYVNGEKTANVAVAQNGKDGKDGVTAPSPTIGANGMWVVYSWDAAKDEFVAEETEIPAAGTSAYAVKANGVYTLYIADENGEMQEIALPATCDSFIVTAPYGTVNVGVKKAVWTPAKGNKVLKALTEKFPALAELKANQELTQGGELPLMVNPSNVELDKTFTFALVNVKGEVADIELANPVKGISSEWKIEKGAMSRGAEAEGCLWTLDVTPAYDKKKYHATGGYAVAENASLVLTNAKGISTRTSFAYNVTTTDASNVSVSGNNTTAKSVAPYASTIDLFDSFVLNGNPYDEPVAISDEFEGYYIITLTNKLQIEKYGLSIAEDGHTLEIENMPSDLSEVAINLNVKAVGLNASTVDANIELTIEQSVGATDTLEGQPIVFNGKKQTILWDINNLGLSAIELDKVLSTGLVATAKYEWVDEAGVDHSVTPAITAVEFYNAKGEPTEYISNGNWTDGAAAKFGFSLNANDVTKQWIAPAEYTIEFKAENTANTVVYLAETTLTTALPEVTADHIKLASAFVEEGVLQVTGTVGSYTEGTGTNAKTVTKVSYDLAKAFVLAEDVKVESVVDAEYDEFTEDESSYTFYNWVTKNTTNLLVYTYEPTPETYTEGWYAAMHQQLYKPRKMTANIYFFDNELNKATYDFTLVVKSTIYSDKPTTVITMDAAKLNTYFGATAADKIAVASVKKAVYAAGPNRNMEYALYKTASYNPKKYDDKEAEYSNYNSIATASINGDYIVTSAGALIEIAQSDWMAMGMSAADFASGKYDKQKFYLKSNTAELYGWNKIMEEMAKYYEWANLSDDTKFAEYGLNTTMSAISKKDADKRTDDEQKKLDEATKWKTLFDKYVGSIVFNQLKDKYQVEKTQTVYHEAIVSVTLEAKDAAEAAKYCKWDGMNITPVSKNDLTVDVKNVKVPFFLVIKDVYGMTMKVPFEVSIVTEEPKA